MTTHEHETDSHELLRTPIVFYTSFLNEVPAILLFFVLSVAAVPLTIKYHWSIKAIELPIPFGYVIEASLPLFALPPLVLFAYIVHQLYNNRYVIGSDHALCETGRLSLRKRETRIDYENVRGIEIDESLLQRIFGVGDLKIGSSMQSEIEIYMSGVRNPEYFRGILEKRIRAHFRRLRHIRRTE